MRHLLRGYVELASTAVRITGLDVPAGRLLISPAEAGAGRPTAPGGSRP